MHSFCPASAQHPRCFRLDDEQQQAHRLRPDSLQRHPVLHRGRGDGERLRQSQSCVSQGAIASFLLRSALIFLFEVALCDILCRK